MVPSPRKGIAGSKVTFAALPQEKWKPILIHVFKAAEHSEILGLVA
jgi:hypothetical protein